MKRLRLERKYLVILTILLTIATMNFLKMVNARIEDIKKEAIQCDATHGYTCTLSELQTYLRNK